MAPKKDDIDMKINETAGRKIMEVDKTNKRNTKPMEKTEAAEAEPKSVMNAFDEQIRNDNSDFRLFADWSKKVSVEDKKLLGKRLGIFKFGSRAPKLPDAQG